MGLLRDYLIKDPVTKRKVTIFIHLCIIVAFVVAMFLPFFNDLAFEQGYEFGNSTCQERIEEILQNITLHNMTEKFDYVFSGEISGS